MLLCGQVTGVIERALIYAAVVFGIIGPGIGFIDIGPLKLYPFRILLPVLFLLFAIRAVTGRFRRYIRSGLVRSYLLFYAIWWTYAVLSLLWAADRGLAVMNIMLLTTGIVAASVIAFYISSARHVRHLCALWLSVSALATGIGIWEILTGNHLPASGYSLEENVMSRFSPSAFFYNKNDFATLIALTIPLVVSWLFHTRSLTRRVAALALLLASGYVLVETKSRGNALAVVLELGCLYVASRPTRSIRRILVTAVVLAILAGGVWYGVDTNESEGLIQRLGELRYDLAPDSVRYNLYMNVPWFVLRSYGLGVGAGNVEHYLATNPVYDTFGYFNIHNWWLEILANYGVLIFALYVYFYIRVCRELIRTSHLSHSREEKATVNALLAGWIGFSVACLSSSSLMPFIPQWLFSGMVLASLNAAASMPTSPTSRSSAERLQVLESSS
jgi:teichuronic acid biosynthesis protein TuaE